MAKYRYVSITFRDGRRDQLVVEESDYYPELIALRRAYGIKYTIGRRLPKGAAKVYESVGRQRIRRRALVSTPRPLSPDFGRGSGGPI